MPPYVELQDSIVAVAATLAVLEVGDGTMKNKETEIEVGCERENVLVISPGADVEEPLLVNGAASSQTSPLDGDVCCAAVVNLTEKDGSVNSGTAVTRSSKRKIEILKISNDDMNNTVLEDEVKNMYNDDVNTTVRSSLVKSDAFGSELHERQLASLGA